MTDATGPEQTKADSDLLRGSIAAELAGDEWFSDASGVLLKFHGTYAQDDRDVRRERGKAGLDPDRMMMVRASIPGGRLTAAQYEALDDLADRFGGGNLRVTTRQGLQYHFVRKGSLAPLIAELNAHLVTTLAACGDVVRNVVACPSVVRDRDTSGVQALAAELSAALKPATSAYWDLWVDGERAVSADPVVVGEPAHPDEPLYGATYLPRKFKVAVAHPGDNCVDALTHDVAVVPHLADGVVTHATIVAGGGLGMTHKRPATFPRLGDPIGVVPRDRVVETVAAIVAVHRDHGDRSDRKHARLKYIVEEWGVPAFRREVEERLGWDLADPEPLDWTGSSDHLGWEQAGDGSWGLGIRVASGRIADGDGGAYRTAVRAIVAGYASEVRFTPNQDVVVAGIADQDRPAVDALLAANGVRPVEDLRPVERQVLACPALPTCGLALAEAERVIDPLTAAVQAELDAVGLQDQPVSVRVTGCPNGCARPYAAEIGVVGRGKDRYTVFVGGSADGTALNHQVADGVRLADVASTLRPALRAWAAEREPGQGLGAWATTTGTDRIRDLIAVPA